MLKIDKSKIYHVKFAQWGDEEDTIEQVVEGRRYFRLRNFLRDLGYEVKEIEEFSK